jgi:hypothetical protein
VTQQADVEPLMAEALHVFGRMDAVLNAGIGTGGPITKVTMEEMPDKAALKRGQAGRPRGGRPRSSRRTGRRTLRGRDPCRRRLVGDARVRHRQGVDEQNRRPSGDELPAETPTAVEVLACWTRARRRFGSATVDALATNSNRRPAADELSPPLR